MHIRLIYSGGNAEREVDKGRDIEAAGEARDEDDGGIKCTGTGNRSELHS